MMSASPRELGVADPATGELRDHPLAVVPHDAGDGRYRTDQLPASRPEVGTATPAHPANRVAGVAALRGKQVVPTPRTAGLEIPPSGPLSLDSEVRGEEEPSQAQLYYQRRQHTRQGDEPRPHGATSARSP
jgi:hypothetical protein